MIYYSIYSIVDEDSSIIFKREEKLLPNRSLLVKKYRLAIQVRVFNIILRVLTFPIKIIITDKLRCRS